MLLVVVVVLAVVAAVFAGHSYWRLRRAVGTRIDRAAFLDALVRSEEADERAEAIARCRAIPRRGISTKFALHLLGLEIPGRIMADLTGSSRDRSRSPAFDSVLDEEIESLVLDLKSFANHVALRSVLGAVLLVAAAGANVLFGAPQVGFAAGALAGVLLVDSLLQWRWVLRSIVETPRRLRPCIVPSEEMSRAQKEAAEEARALLGESTPARSKKRLKSSRRS